MGRKKKEMEPIARGSRGALPAEPPEVIPEPPEAIIEHPCGHKFTHYVGPAWGQSRRRSFAFEQRTQDCPDCRVAAAAKQDKAENLPELTGTPKQKLYGMNVRRQMLATVDSIMPEGPKLFALWDVYVDYCRLQTSAEFWISAHVSFGGPYRQYRRGKDTTVCQIVWWYESYAEWLRKQIFAKAIADGTAYRQIERSLPPEDKE